MSTYVQPPLNKGPGVYFQEVSSGSHAIAGVSTAVTAFVGDFYRGPWGTPIPISSWSQFQNTFGGILSTSPVTYAVQDFFLNGGQQAIIVRQYKAPAKADAKKAGAKDGDASGAAGAASGPPSGTASASVGGADVWANSPGAWGNNLKVAISVANAATSTWAVSVTYVPDPTRPSNTLTESFTNLSLDGSSGRRFDTYINANSQYLWIPSVPSSVKKADATALANGKASDTLDKATYEDPTTGYQAVLEKTAIFNLLYIPPPTFVAWAGWAKGDDYTTILGEAAEYCNDKRAFLILDPFPAWLTSAKKGSIDSIQVTDYAIGSESAPFAAVYFPGPVMGLNAPDPYPIGGIVTGIMAYTDATRGVWKAPAGQATGITGALSLPIGIPLTDQGTLNSNAVNMLRVVPSSGVALWGARTVAGSDVLDSDYKYINIRRLTNFIELSLVQGTQWAVFEPNNEQLWGMLNMSITGFMTNLWRQGALVGTSADQAFTVQVDSDTTTPQQQRQGILNVIVSFAPVYPAEFIILYIQQQAMPSGS